MLVYLHGFNSSPASHKAQVMKDFLERRGQGHLYACPALPDTPREALRAIEAVVEAKSAGRAAGAITHRYALGAQPPRKFPGGDLRLVTVREFPISTTMCGATMSAMSMPSGGTSRTAGVSFLR